MKRITELIIIISFGTFLGLDLPFILEITLGTPPIGDLLDILFIFPLYLIGTYTIFRIFSPRSSYLQYFYIFSIGLFAEGHGLHWAANAIHNSMVSGEKGFQIAYFLDEVLGHLLLFSGAFLTLISLCVMQHRKKINIGKKDKIWLIISSIPFGFFLSIGFIEGQVIYIFLPATVLLLLFLLYYSYKSKIRFEEEPFNMFILYTSSVIIVLSVIYYIIFGSFIEPSKIFHF